jgi:hypothetical protein
VRVGRRKGSKQQKEASKREASGQGRGSFCTAAVLRERLRRGFPSLSPPVNLLLRLYYNKTSRRARALPRKAQTVLFV